MLSTAKLLGRDHGLFDERPSWQTRPHRTAAEQRGVSDTDVFTNEQLATTLDELIKVYGKAQGEAFFRLGRTRHQRIRVVAMGRLPIILRNAPCVSRCGMPCGRPLCGLLWVIARRGKRPLGSSKRLAHLGDFVGQYAGWCRVRSKNLKPLKLLPLLSWNRPALPDCNRVEERTDRTRTHARRSSCATN